MTLLAVIFAVLTGMFKALRDRDLWHGSGREDSDATWYGEWRWYEAWSQTGASIGPFPLDAWHNLDLACMASAVMSGGMLWPEYGWWSIVAVFTFALPSKFLFYHVLLLRHPIAELREYWADLKREYLYG